ncbi:MAG: OmpA family protein, partial [Alphaproteobacteria bacterium]|nr:OmpA family protein [Alphaproteobacteria bacterium]
RLALRFNLDFKSNWELSTARALSVVHFLIKQGIAPVRLAATGFGEYHPLDTEQNDIAYRKNRRIEFKLTNR